MIVQNAAAYMDTNAYEHHYPSQQQQQPSSAVSMQATSPPGYQQYQQASPAGSQTSMHNVVVTQQQSYQDIRAPQTPTTPMGSSAYIAPSPRGVMAPVSHAAFVGDQQQHPDSPLARVMRTPMPYPNAPDIMYARSASVAPSYVDPALIRNSRSVAPPQSQRGYNESCEMASSHQSQMPVHGGTGHSGSSGNVGGSHGSGHGSKQRSRDRQREQQQQQPQHQQQPQVQVRSERLHVRLIVRLLD